MPIFAEISAEGWTLIIGAISLGLLKMLSMYLDYKRDESQRLRDEAAAKAAEEVKRLAAIAAEKADEAAVEVKEVKDTLATTTTSVTEKIDDMAVNVDHGLKLNNSTLLATAKREMEADERMANSSDATEGDRFRASASKERYLQMLKDGEKLDKDIKEAAEKRADAKIKAAGNRE